MQRPSTKFRQSLPQRRESIEACACLPNVTRKGNCAPARLKKTEVGPIDQVFRDVDTQSRFAWPLNSEVEHSIANINRKHPLVGFNPISVGPRFASDERELIGAARDDTTGR